MASKMVLVTLPKEKHILNDLARRWPTFIHMGLQHSYDDLSRNMWKEILQPYVCIQIYIYISYICIYVLLFTAISIYCAKVGMFQLRKIFLGQRFFQVSGAMNVVNFIPFA